MHDYHNECILNTPVIDKFDPDKISSAEFWHAADKYFSTDSISNSINYNNIFLTIYLVLFFILINLFFKITMAPFHF